MQAVGRVPTRFVREFGLKAFRRPLEPAELKRYEALFVKEKDFINGAQLVVEAMLQSPHFLFRLEETNNPRWKPYARRAASRMRCGTRMPDDALLASAAQRRARHARRRREGCAAHARSIPKAKQALDEFVSPVDALRSRPDRQQGRRRFPQFTRETAVAMTEEARPLHRRPGVERRNFMKLFTADYGYRERRPGRHLRRASARQASSTECNFPPDSERAGLLGQALFLALTSKPDETSPTARGLVRPRAVSLPARRRSAAGREHQPAARSPRRSRRRTASAWPSTRLNKSCAGCHNLIDPIGFGFEKFDAVGARRDKMQLQFFGRAAKAIGERRRRPWNSTRHHGTCRRHSRTRSSRRRRNSARCWPRARSARNAW